MEQLNFKGIKLLVVGDVMVDRYLEGRVSGQSPEADVPIFRKRSVSIYPGGAANVAANISNLGAQSYLIGTVGNDVIGHQLKDLINGDSSIHNRIITLNDRITTVKTRIISDKIHLARIDEENDEPLSSNQEEMVINHITECIEAINPDGLIFQDYNKGILTHNTIIHTIETCKEKNIATFVDPKFDNLMSYRGVTLFKPNKRELEFLLQDKVSIYELQNTDVLRRLKDRLDCRYLVVTLGGSGIIYVDDHNLQHIQGVDRNVIDVCGAGDTVIASLASAICAGFSIHKSSFIANLAGGLVCEESGVQPIKLHHLEKEIQKF